jgi:2-keto-4-pentenoate hydratase/2-oxohepta-3-ene-1,7-dioic acid hydratase in catechol pathway
MNLIRADYGVAVETPSGPLPIRYIIGIGRNYAEHAKEQGAAAPTRPMVFVKSPVSACLDGDDIVIPRACQDAGCGGEQTDFEAELCVVIGTAARDVPESRALEHVLGYCCANDVSARWWQKEGSGGQFCRGKSFDTFCPMGPTLVPAAEIEDPQQLRVRCRLNGQTMQDASTGDMMFPVAALIAELSRGATLPPGTAILTGTPSGVGMARKPPVWLKNGDTVEIEIEGIGTLRNGIRAEA